MQFVSQSSLTATSNVSPPLNTDAGNPIVLGHSISSCVERCVSVHEHLYLEGDVQSHIYFVTSGVICTYKLLADGRRQICAFAYPGDVLGADCTERYLTHAEALSECVVRSIPVRAIDGLMMSEPGFGKALLQIVAMDLASTREQLLSLGRKTATEKLATFLLVIARRHSLPGHSDVLLDLPMKRCDIADYLGLTIETVSRNFTRLKSSGVIKLLSSHKVQIDDIDMLSAIANGGEAVRLH